MSAAVLNQETMMTGPFRESAFKDDMEQPASTKFVARIVITTAVNNRKYRLVEYERGRYVCEEQHRDNVGDPKWVEYSMMVSGFSMEDDRAKRAVLDALFASVLP